MPLTLEKLFSETVESTLEILGETVHLTWAPSRWTGEMADLAVQIADEESTDKVQYEALLEAGDVAAATEFKRKVDHRQAAQVRAFVSQMLVAWDVLDGKVPHPFDDAGLKKLPPWFVIAVFNAMSEENASDPTNAPSSDGTSRPKASSERSRRGSSSSGARKSSGARRGT